MEYGSQSEVGKIKSILLKHSKEGFKNQSFINKQWQSANYLEKPDYVKAVAEYDNFLELMNQITKQIYFLPDSDDTGLDSIYLHDPVIITNKGAILCNMGKVARRGEVGSIGAFLNSIDIPILGEISGEGTVEGGDVVWLDKKTIAVGEGYRTNPEGISQLKSILDDLVDEFITVPLPHSNGPNDVLHLMSLISPIDYDLAVVYSRLMPVRFRNYLIRRGIKLIEVSDSEYETMGCNILAIEPRMVIMLNGNETTKNALKNEGVGVLTYQGNEISRKGCGGPTCLTRPIYREDG